jgi:hypothetical protein
MVPEIPCQTRAGKGGRLANGTDVRYILRDLARSAGNHIHGWMLMSRRRQICRVAAGAGVAMSLLAWGCQTKPQQSAQADHPADSGRYQLLGNNATQPSAATDGTPPGTAEVLAEKAQSYARNVGPLLDHRGASGESNPVADAVNPNELALGPDSQPTTAPATVSSSASGPAQPVLDVKTVRPKPSIDPMPAAQAASGELSTDALTRQLAQHVHDYPQDLAGQLDYQLLEMLQGESVPQLTTLSPLAPEDREVVSALLDGVTNFRDAVRADNNMLLSRKVRPLLDMADRLRNQAELSVPTVALCKRVAGFGVYDPIDGARFAAGQDTPVVVYCEVDNFASRLNDQRMWETKLKLQVVLYEEESGMEVWRQKDMAAGTDLSRNRRHDFFMAEMIHLPASLTIGRYLLKVSVEDQEVNRIAENTVGVQIVAQ